MCWLSTISNSRTLLQPLLKFGLRIGRKLKSENWKLKNEDWKLKTEKSYFRYRVGLVVAGMPTWIDYLTRPEKAIRWDCRNAEDWRLSFLIFDFSVFSFQISVFRFQFSVFSFRRKLKNGETTSPDSASTPGTFRKSATIRLGARAWWYRPRCRFPPNPLASYPNIQVCGHTKTENWKLKSEIWKLKTENFRNLRSGSRRYDVGATCSLVTSGPGSRSPLKNISEIGFISEPENLDPRESGQLCLLHL